MQRFGAHMSVAGGFANAFEAGEKAGCDCLQIFVKNQRQWSAKPLDQAAIDEYREAAERTKLSPVVAHASYLLNLASPEAANRKKSEDALVDELTRSAQLGVDMVVFHPGAHMGDGVEIGIERIAASIDKVAKRVDTDAVKLLLETTAGQGSAIGYELAHLRSIIDQAKCGDWLGVCVDTCHIFAAGYDIRSEEGYESFVGELIDLSLLDRVDCFHVNDSMKDCGSRVDRHDHIGKGKIGKAGFEHLVNDKRLTHVPCILETPKGVDGRGTDLDRVNLNRLRGLIRK